VLLGRGRWLREARSRASLAGKPDLGIGLLSVPDAGFRNTELRRRGEGGVGLRAPQRPGGPLPSRCLKRRDSGTT
jgi:hypothetical protein